MGASEIYSISLAPILKDSQNLHTVTFSFNFDEDQKIHKKLKYTVTCRYLS